MRYRGAPLEQGPTWCPSGAREAVPYNDPCARHPCDQSDKCLPTGSACVHGSLVGIGWGLRGTGAGTCREGVCTSTMRTGAHRQAGRSTVYSMVVHATRRGLAVAPIRHASKHGAALNTCCTDGMPHHAAPIN